MADREEADPPLWFRAHIFCCTNVRDEGHPRGSCGRKGADDLRDYMKKQTSKLGLKGEVRVNNAGCLDRCEYGPTMVIYPEGVWYTYRDKADIDEILRVHVIGGGRVERLMLGPEHTREAAKQASRAAE